jgi:hypothetical protein
MNLARTATLLLLALGACSRKAPGRVLLYENGDAGVHEALARPVGGAKGAVERITDTSDTMPYDDGKAVIAVELQGATQRIVRHPLGALAVTSSCIPSGTSPKVVAVAHDGHTVMLEDDGKDIANLEFINVDTCAKVTHTTKLAWRTVISPDGEEAIVGAVPASCTSDNNHCPANLFRLKMGGAVDVARGGARASYQPLYLKDGRVLFQTTERDATCDGTINACRHDIVAAPRNALDTPSLEVIREGAVGPLVTNDQKKLVYLEYLDPSTGCHGKLPCSTMELMIGDLKAKSAGKDAHIASEVAVLGTHALSLDNSRIAFVASSGTDRITRVCKIDGKDCETVGNSKVLGWVK